MSEIPGDGAQWILLHHHPDLLQFLGGFIVIDFVHEAKSLQDGQIGPVGAIGVVTVVRMEEIGEDLFLVLICVCPWIMGMVSTRFGAMRGTDHSIVGRVVGLVGVESVVVRHDDVRVDCGEWI